jgi:Rieske Fe-S protein
MDPAGNVVRSGSRLNKVLLVRLDPAVLDPPTGGRAADGVVAYSAICPHTGCEVVGWSADLQILECPCHNSRRWKGHRRAFASRPYLVAFAYHRG